MQHLPTAEALPRQLQTALLRGEVFNLMRDYLALGASYQWHPLVTQSLSVINNLSDGSALLQGQVSVDAAQNQQLQFGYIGGYADAGDEFAPLPAAISPQGRSLPKAAATAITCAGLGISDSLPQFRLPSCWYSDWLG